MSEPTPSMSRDEAEEQLREWAEEHGWQIVFPNDALDADVRPGVVDAVNPTDARTADYGNAGLWVRVRHDGSTVPGLARTYYVAYLHLSRIDVAVADGSPVDVPGESKPPHRNQKH